jgi:hypothetical protein
MGTADAAQGRATEIFLTVGKHGAGDLTAGSVK